MALGLKEQDCMYSIFQSKVTGLEFAHLNVYSAFVQTEPTGGMDLGFRVGARCLQSFSLQCEHLKHACGGVVCGQAVCYTHWPTVRQQPRFSLAGKL